MEYEYGIWRVDTDEIHRIGFTEETALDWMTEWREDGGLKDAFYIVRRPISGWSIW